MKHKYNIGQLVELDSGVRLFVIVKFPTYDSGSCVYGLGHEKASNVRFLMGESALSPVHNPTYREPS